jgi:hypothetical protein
MHIFFYLKSPIFTWNIEANIAYLVLVFSELPSSLVKQKLGTV